MSEHERWRPRALLARVVTAAIVVLPTAAGFGAGLLLSILLGQRIGRVATVAAAVVVGAAVAALVVRLTRFLAPLSFLLRLDLLFPDELPSRFRVALRAGGPARLAAEPDRRSATKVLELATAMAAHDGRTRGHSERVRAYTDLLAEQLRLRAHDRDRLRWSALLHDIGKVEVAPDILNKPGRLDDVQWQVMRRHPEAGAELVEPLRPFLGSWVDAVVDHHERFDGTGYPAGKRGAEISLAGRIVAVADAYDVMTTASRVYRRPTTPEAAQAELVACAGTQFDPMIVRAFLAIPNEALRRRSVRRGAIAAVGGAVLAGPAGARPVGAHLPAGASPPGGLDAGDGADVDAAATGKD